MDKSKLKPLVFSLLVLALSTSACDDDPAESEDDSSGHHHDPMDHTTGSTGDEEDNPFARLEQLLDCDEVDFESTHWMGPLFDPETGAQVAELSGPYVVATTLGYAKDDADGEAFGTMNTRVVEDLFQRDGFLGVRLGASEGCGSATTLSLWRDEASLMAMVFTPPHSEAMALSRTMTKAWQTTHWTEQTSGAPPSWLNSRARLAEARR